MAKGKWNADYFADRIRTERIQRKWTHKQLAEFMSSNSEKVDVTTVSKIERGERAVRISEAAVLADLFDTTVDALLGRTARQGDEATYALTAALDSARRSRMELTGIQNELNKRFGELEGLDVKGLDDLTTVAEMISAALRFAADGLDRIAYYRQVSNVPMGDIKNAYKQLIRDTATQAAREDK